ncbi:uncharacterized protein LOC125573265 [Nematostella vectensis]|uniref:uncharacterized protein LOC125573265 n=1 Tax=Nematostella vectensis TaxID=45351 RepID=UPI002076DFE0|nr:uncharacterized protein LOC125573265 [Nematostella vectensis]
MAQNGSMLPQISLGNYEEIKGARENKTSEVNILPGIIAEAASKKEERFEVDNATVKLPPIGIHVEGRQNVKETKASNGGCQESFENSLPIPFDEKETLCLKQLNIEKKLKNKVDDSAIVDKNFELRCDLAFKRFSQRISRVNYTYFHRFPSPPPLNKRERLRKKMEESKPKKKTDDSAKPVPGELRPKEEYAGILNSIDKVQREFAKRHRLRHQPLRIDHWLTK